jgi:hypothetical protein
MAQSAFGCEGTTPTGASAGTGLDGPGLRCAPGRLKALSMTLLLNTRAFLGWVNGEPRPFHAEDFQSAREHGILLSAATAWEMTIKARIGKLALSRGRPKSKPSGPP